VLLLPAAPAWAHFGGDQGERRVSADLWASLRRPGLERARQLQLAAEEEERQALRQLPDEWSRICRHALSPQGEELSIAMLRGRLRGLKSLLRHALERRAHLDGALTRIERAVALDPENPELLFTWARMLQFWENPSSLTGCRSERRDEEALAVYARLRELDPEFMPASVAASEGILLTRLSRYGDATEAYLRAIALSLDPERSANSHYNLAEVSMLDGQLERALAHYRRALDVAREPHLQLLALWGLAVAYDRLGEHQAAIEHARKASYADGRQLRILRSPSVFFVPRHELHYYEALGHEALADAAESPEQRITALQAALRSWHAFLAAAGPEGAFAADARDNLRRLQVALGAQRDKTKAEALP